MEENRLGEGINCVQHELNKIKESIPQIINSDVLHAFRYYAIVQKELLELKEEQRKLKAELTRWKNKSETAQQELRTEKQMHRQAQEMIAGLKEQLSMEVQYCAKLGSSSCGLLWSLSKQGLPHSTIHTMCLKNFLDTVEQTLVNFSHADSKVDTDSDEMKLVESLCGIIANITACDDGRDYVIENDAGKSLLSTVLSVLPSLSQTPSVLKLILMFLFNVSIHVDGQAKLTKLLDSSLLDTFINKTRDYQIILGCLKIFDSLHSESGDPTFGLTSDSVMLCLSHPNKDVRNYAALLFNSSSENREL